MKSKHLRPTGVFTLQILKDNLDETTFHVTTEPLIASHIPSVFFPSKHLKYSLIACLQGTLSSMGVIVRPALYHPLCDIQL